MSAVDVLNSGVIIQPAWITVAVQLLTLLVAAGISYGMTRAKLSSNEKQIIELRRDVTQLQLEFQKWQRDRTKSVVTGDDCTRMQATCRESICRKIDNLTVSVDSFRQVTQTNWQNLAIVIGAICQKLEIDPPELRG
jgi:hypothetical protein